ncbi:MAG TPA: hypothetical protein VFW53_02920, partial [Gallionella sp.]|nr:hypothetical protein [Gallionella sp.]
NAMRASLALINLDANCAAAGMQGGAKNVSVLSDVKPYTVQRRLVNPVKLSASVTCAGQPSATAVEVPQMQAGERYSVFLLTLKNTRQAVFAHDAN